MASLKGQSINTSYQSLLKTDSTTGLSTTSANVEDGKGTKSALNISVNDVNVTGKLGINKSAPTHDLHIVTASVQPVLVEDSSGYDQFFIGDSNSNFNAKLGDIDSASPGSNTHLHIDDTNTRIVANSTFFGVNQTSPTAALHVGNFAGSAKFELGTSTNAFDVNGVLTVDTTNSEVEVDGDLEVSGNLRRSPQRYYLEEFFKRLPASNGSIGISKNLDFEILGKSSSDDDITYSPTNAGIACETDGLDADAIIILPHLDTNQTAWENVNWGTENAVEWEAAITTGPDITNYSTYAGLKLTSTGVYTFDNDQAYFLFATDDDQGALTTNANMHFVYSIGGTDYVTDLNFAVAANTEYRLRISIDGSRQVRVYVNEVQYGLAQTSVAGGIIEGTNTTPSLALTDDIDFTPYIAIEALAAASKGLTVHYQKISRDLFE